MTIPPLVVNADMTIIGGHQRLTVAMTLGYTEVPCAVVGIDKVREKALNIALNKITGAWDENLLAELLQDIQNSEFDLGKTGFEPPEIEQLFNSVHDKQVDEDNFDVEELKKPTFSQPGDIWILGRHRVICGDSTKPETYEKLMEGQKAKRYLAWCQEKQTADVAYVLRDGQKLSYEEALAAMPQDGDADYS